MRRRSAFCVPLACVNRRVFAVLAGEGLLTSAAGSLVGVAVGVGYAALMLAGLRTWWLSAISTPFLHLTSRRAASAWDSWLASRFHSLRWSGRCAAWGASPFTGCSRGKRAKRFCRGANRDAAC